MVSAAMIAGGNRTAEATKAGEDECRRMADIVRDVTLYISPVKFPLPITSKHWTVNMNVYRELYIQLAQCVERAHKDGYFEVPGLLRPDAIILRKRFGNMAISFRRRLASGKIGKADREWCENILSVMNDIQLKIVSTPPGYCKLTFTRREAWRGNEAVRKALAATPESGRDLTRWEAIDALSKEMDDAIQAAATAQPESKQTGGTKIWRDD